MANQRITFRCPQDVLALLPADPYERSRFILEALRDKAKPATPEQELAQLKREMLELKRSLAK